MASMLQNQAWYSIIGYLYVKTNGGAFSLLKSRKRMFFALDESKNLLNSYKDEMDFLKKKKPLEKIRLDQAACTLGENSETEFVIHVDGRKLEFDAENEQSANKWFNALQHRRENVEMITTVRRKKIQQPEAIRFETTSSGSDCEDDSCANDGKTEFTGALKTKVTLWTHSKLIS
uniref:PH domain-containing protein n=1 Tax=Onchocerca volvulus TaxID=6282 RepID=A0A8R1XTE4_ONCVO